MNKIMPISYIMLLGSKKSCVMRKKFWNIMGEKLVYYLDYGDYHMGINIC